ncbi:MAG: hypothetical protein ACJAV1_002692 [Paraglaciecola sp.]|jgi:hypothetical protein
MTKTRLAAALSLALLVVPVSQAAKYTVVELPVADKGQSSFPSAINEAGNITVNMSSPYNIPIDLDLLDFESVALVNALTDIESASIGNFNSIDYEILLSAIRTGDTLQSAQQIANTISFLASETEINYIPVFDQPTQLNDEFTLSSNTIARDVNDMNFVVGSGEGFYKKVDYTFKTSVNAGEVATFVVHDFGTRGFVSLGDNTIVDLPAPALTAGGFSEAYGINEGNQVVGYGSTLFLSDTLETGIANCENEELIDDEDPQTPESDHLPLRGDIPIESCISSVVGTLTGSVTLFAQLRGLIWQLDAQGNLLETKELGILFEPEVDDDTNYSSQALAINDNGIAVGVSNGQYPVNGVNAIRNFGVIFDEDQIINITPEPDSIVAQTSTTISSAADINNNNLVVGYQIKSINGTNRTKFYVYDMNLAEITFPADFFLGSSSIALDINNNGLVVGYGDIDASLTGRRTGGFLYDNEAEQFNGIQDLISCDSPYTIVQANSINDKNEIVATALYKGPLRDSRGEIILDSAGNESIVDLVSAVKLEPIEGGEIENCEIADEINKDRQAASVTWMLALGMVLLGWRRYKNQY